MRLGEIKKTINQVLNDQHIIEVHHEAIFGGQAYVIKNYVEIIEALDFLSDQKWNESDFTQVSQIKEGKELKNPTQLTQDEYNQLNAYINAVNQKLPLYYSILETMVKEQEELAINIKLPEGKIKSLSELSELNSRLEKILKLFNVDGQFEFVGFDKGTDWYEILAKGVLSNGFLICCLKTAQEYLKTKQEYFKSKKAELDYKAGLKNDDKPTEKGLVEYSENRLQLDVQNRINKAIDDLGTGSKTKPELMSQLIKGTQNLINELDDGTEFHLSLNPPNYANEQNGLLEIDYKNLQAIKAKELEETKKQKKLKSPDK